MFWWIVIGSSITYYIYEMQISKKFAAEDLTNATNKNNDLAKNKLENRCELRNGNITFDEQNRITDCVYYDPGTGKRKEEQWSYLKKNVYFYLFPQSSSS